MRKNIAENCSAFEKVLNKIENDKAFAKIGNGLELSVGLESDSAFAVPAQASDAVYVGDSKHILGSSATAEVAAMFEKDPNSVNITPKYDPLRQGWTMDFQKKIVTDSYLDGQLYLPWNVSWFKKVFREPLNYTHAFDLVRKDNGSNPWAEIMSLPMEQYAGWGTVLGAGDLQNQAVNDVNVVNGMMSGNVINMMVTYSITQAEKERASGPSSNPYGESSIVMKQRYANYVLNMMKAYLIYYGNDKTGTKGLLNVNPITTVAAADSLNAIATGTSASKGSDMFAILAKYVNEFLEAADNKFDNITIAMAPAAYNLLTSTPYSSVYNPTAAMKIFNENYMAGKGPNGNGVNVKFVSDPMLKATSEFNPDSADYMVMTTPSIGTGPDDTKQDLVLFGAPLDEYVFPAIPGMYNTQYKTLSRTAGIFAPVPQAIKAFKGFGIQ